MNFNPSTITENFKNLYRLSYVLLVFTSLFLISCIQESEGDQIVVQSQFQLNLQNDIDEDIPLDSIVVQVQSPTLDTTILFTSDSALYSSETFQFNITIPKGDSISMSYDIYTRGEIIKSGVLDYQSGKYSSLEQSGYESYKNDSLIVVIIEEIRPIQQKLLLAFEKDFITISEGAVEEFKLVFQDNGSLDTLENDCEVAIKNSYISDLKWDTLVTFRAGSHAQTFKQIQMRALTDNLVERTEDFRIQLESNCEEIQLSNKISLDVEVRDKDSVTVEWVNSSDTLQEQDTSWVGRVLVKFTPQEAQLSQAQDIEIVVDPSLPSSKYQILSGTTLNLAKTTQHLDTLEFELKLDIEDDEILDDQAYEIGIETLSEDLKLNGPTSTSITLMNDDFRYYFISDTLNHAIYVYDHEFNYLRDIDLGSFRAWRLLTRNSDTLDVITTTGVFHYDLADDKLYSSYPSDGLGFLETDSYYYYRSSSNEISYAIWGLAFPPQTTSLESTPFDNGQVGLYLHPTDDDIQAVYSQGGQLVIEDLTSDELTDLPLENNAYLVTYEDRLVHSSGRTFYSISQLIGFNQYGMITEHLEGELKMFSSSDGVSKGDQGLFEVPRQMVEDIDTSILFTAPFDQKVFRMDPNSGIVEVAIDLKTRASLKGLFGISVMETHQKIVMP